MVVPELAAVVVAPLVLQQGARPRVMEPRVVQHHETGERREIAPHEVVAGRVAELVDDKIVGIAARLPPEVAGVAVAKTVDRVRRREPPDEISAVGGDPGSDRRQRREPRNAHGLDHND